jgi:hypothetical protein
VPVIEDLELLCMLLLVGKRTKGADQEWDGDPPRVAA